MSKQLPSREQAIELLRKNKCSPQIIKHCLAVADLSLEIANQLKSKGFDVDLSLVEAGALLHDIGRSKTNAVDHGVSRRANCRILGSFRRQWWQSSDATWAEDSRLKRRRSWAGRKERIHAASSGGKGCFVR